MVYAYVIFTQIAKFMGPTWGPPGSCRPQMGPMLAHESCYQGNFAVSGVPVGGLALSGAKSSADRKMTKFVSRIYAEPALVELKW